MADVLLSVCAYADLAWFNWCCKRLVPRRNVENRLAVDSGAEEALSDYVGRQCVAPLFLLRIARVCCCYVLRYLLPRAADGALVSTVTVLLLSFQLCCVALTAAQQGLCSLTVVHSHSVLFCSSQPRFTSPVVMTPWNNHYRKLVLVHVTCVHACVYR